MLTREHISIELVQRDGRLCAMLGGEIDHHTARILREEIDRALLREAPHTLELDFSGIEFMDSSGIGFVIGRLERARAVGAVVILSGMSHRIRAMLELSGTERLPGLILATNKREEVAEHEEA